MKMWEECSIKKTNFIRPKMTLYGDLKECNRTGPYFMLKRIAQSISIKSSLPRGLFMVSYSFLLLVMGEYISYLYCFRGDATRRPRTMNVK